MSFCSLFSVCCLAFLVPFFPSCCLPLCFINFFFSQWHALFPFLFSFEQSSIGVFFCDYHGAYIKYSYIIYIKLITTIIYKYSTNTIMHILHTSTSNTHSILPISQITSFYIMCLLTYFHSYFFILLSFNFYSRVKSDLCATVNKYSIWYLSIYLPFPVSFIFSYACMLLFNILPFQTLRTFVRQI